MHIDLNADLGEGAGTDAELMPLVTSANVSCGFHAGDPEGIRATLGLARCHGVVVGAHPGYPDRENFGRVEHEWPLIPLSDEIARQIGHLMRLAEPLGVPIRYVKPHGALYNRACREAGVAGSVVRAAKRFMLPVVGLPGSALESAALHHVPFVTEGFADRRYRPDGSLVPRSEPGAFVDELSEAVAQVEWLIREKGVRTICVHGDNPAAVAFVGTVRDALLARGFELKAFA